MRIQTIQTGTQHSNVRVNSTDGGAHSEAKRTHHLKTGMRCRI
jgi:hypothetical protein